VTREPEMALFRQILAGDEVTCPAPVARAAPAAARTAPARGAAPAGTGTGARAPAAAAQPAQPAPAAQGNLGNALRGTGIIR